jgi:hypothetical protein
VSGPLSCSGKKKKKKTKKKKKKEEEEEEEEEASCPCRESNLELSSPWP